MATDDVMNYILLKFESSSDSYFYDVLNIYSRVTPRDERTNSSEITFWVDNQNKFPNGKLFFFGLLLNSKPIGYAEVAHVDHILIIDYIAIDDRYNSKSSFFSFLSLIFSYINKTNIDYDYIIKEIICEQKDKKSEIIKLYEFENFKVINAPYIQPQLEARNIESNKEAILMIYQKNMYNSVIKKKIYMDIVGEVYSYYEKWDTEISDNKIKLPDHWTHDITINNINKIEKNLTKDEVNINGYPFNFNSSINKDLIPDILNKKSSNITKGFFFSFIIILMIVAILWIKKECEIETKDLIIISFIIICIIAITIAFFDDRGINVLKRIPFLSRFF